MAVRGVRGATTAESNTAESILAATRTLLEQMASANAIQTEDLAAAYFTVTEDLDAAFPAHVARKMGWDQVPLLDAREIPVPGSLPRCIRVLLLWNTETPQGEIVHVYQAEAIWLRPDLVKSATMVQEGEKR
ncbi:MAG: chorismate mutase [Anaerolineae bacterium]|nr:chorismate mutase [Anaerolineae bacterium]